MDLRRPRPSLATIQAHPVEQATIMRDAGADLLSLEIMVDIPRMTAPLDAVKTIGLPVWDGLTVGPEEGHDVDKFDDKIQLSEGDLLSVAVEIAKRYDASREKLSLACVWRRRSYRSCSLNL